MNHITAFTIAATTPKSPPITPRTLSNPPRVRGESDNRTPIRPATIAKPANINPPIAPTLKVRIPATTATMDGMLNDVDLELELMVT